METAKQHVQRAILKSGLSATLAGVRDATNTLKASVALWIRNQRAMQEYPDSEDKCQTMSCNAMRIEAGIKFLYMPYSGK